MAAASAPALKYLRSSSGGKIPGSPGNNKKLAIFARLPIGFDLYVVDFDLDKEGGGCLEIKPRIQNRIPPPEGVFDVGIWEGCVVNSTLYIFQEFSAKFNHTQYEREKMLDNKAVKKFHLSADFLNSDEVIGRSSWESLGINEISAVDQIFEDLTPMKWHKNSPVAVPTPDGGKKILVFDKVIEVQFANTCFELYDPPSNTWSPVELPASFASFASHCRPNSILVVEHYAFIDESRFAVWTSEGGHFTLDLNPEKKKKEVADLPCPLFYNNEHSITVDGPVIISPGAACRLGSIGGSDIIGSIGSDIIEFGLSTLDPPDDCPKVLPSPFITLLDLLEARHADTLVSRIYQPGECYHHGPVYLTIDACRTLLDSDTLDTKVFRTLKYQLAGDFLCISSAYVSIV